MPHIEDLEPPYEEQAPVAKRTEMIGVINEHTDILSAMSATIADLQARVAALEAKAT